MAVRKAVAAQTQQAAEQQLHLLVPEPLVLAHVPTGEHDKNCSKRERLATLVAGDLNFHGSNGSYASHDIHAFAAKFPPQLPLAFIRGLTEPGDTILDPMMGSGTTIVESQIENRYGIGLDIDPLALRISRTKTTTLDVAALQITSQDVVTQAHALLHDSDSINNTLEHYFDAKTKKFIDYWFFGDTQRELMALTLAIHQVECVPIRRFLELTFSSIIVTKSGGVSRARDLAHGRPHLVADKVPRNALDQFVLRLRKNIASIARLTTTDSSAYPLLGDARSMPFKDEVIDLIVTSPPYANAIDYMRAHKFSLVWLRRSIDDLSILRAKYIGSERVNGADSCPLPERTEQIIWRLAELDVTKSKILRKYFYEMKDVLSEMYRVLRADSVAVMVVGTSTMRGIDVQTHLCLAEIAATLGFDVVGIVQRTLDRDKRMMPARFGKKGDSMIEQRMHEEYVIGLLKPGGEARGSHAKP